MSLYIALAVLELKMKMRLASKSQRSCLCLPNAGIKGMSHYAQLHILKFKEATFYLIFLASSIFPKRGEGEGRCKNIFIDNSTFSLTIRLGEYCIHVDFSCSFLKQRQCYNLGVHSMSDQQVFANYFNAHHILYLFFHFIPQAWTVI